MPPLLIFLSSSILVLTLSVSVLVIIFVSGASIRKFVKTIITTAKIVPIVFIDLLYLSKKSAFLIFLLVQSIIGNKTSYFVLRLISVKYFSPSTKVYLEKDFAKKIAA